MAWWRKGRKEADGVETLVTEGAKARGGFALKVVAAGLVGFPDRIVVLPGGRIGFLELKRRDKEPELEQYWWIDRLINMGFVAYWTRSRAGVEQFFQLLEAA